LLSAKVERHIDPDALEWNSRALASPAAPSLVLPAGWEEDLSAPFPCRGLAQVDSALSASPPGDFRVSLRSGYWQRGSRTAESAARACGERPGTHGASSYRYGLEYLGVGYAVEGAFMEMGDGLLQLEVVAPVETSGFLAELTRAWIEQRAANPDPK
ncbi:MAG: hypothetical protein ACRD21_06080, partial [Vicinamibacteria bacterium]